MGNRGNVIFTSDTGSGLEIGPNVYLHWNGSAESIYPFLAELKRRGLRYDVDYRTARFIQLVGEFFDHGSEERGLSLGVMAGPEEISEIGLQKVRTDTSDNGFFIVSPDGVRRFLTVYKEEADNHYSYSFKEWTPEEVEEERALATTSPYAEGLAGVFAEIESDKVRERQTA